MPLSLYSRRWLRLCCRSSLPIMAAVANTLAPPSLFGDIPLGSRGEALVLTQPEVLASAASATRRHGLPSLPDCVHLVRGLHDWRISVDDRPLQVLGQTSLTWVFVGSRRVAAGSIQQVAIKCLWTPHCFYEPEPGVSDLVGRGTLEPIHRLRVRAKDLPKDFPLKSGWFEDQLRALRVPSGKIHDTILAESRTQRRTTTIKHWVTMRARTLGALHRTDGQPGPYVASGGRDYEHPSLLIVVTPLLCPNVRPRPLSPR